MPLSFPPILTGITDQDVLIIHEYLYQLIELLEELEQGIGSGGGAPVNASYVVTSIDATLTAERVVTDSATIDFDVSVADQVTADVINGSISNVKLAAMPALTVKGNNTNASAQPLDLTVAQLSALLFSGAVDRVVEIGETRVVPDQHSLVVSTYFNVLGTLDLQGDAVLDVI